MTKRVYATDEIAEDLGVTVRAVQQWLKDGDLAGELIGRGRRGTWIVFTEDYELFKQEREKQKEA